MDNKRFLLFDVGNTNTKLGLSSQGRIVASFRFPTWAEDTGDSWGFRVLQACRLWGLEAKDISAWVVSSVVPQLNNSLQMAGERFCSCPVYFVPQELALDLENHYARPQEVGADRLVTAFGARELFTTPALIIVDFGTATTFDCVQDRAYLGGLIGPGVISAAKGLTSQTAKLPQISLELDSTELQIGHSTSTSLNQGFVFGFAAMIEGLCARLEDKLSGPLSIVGTGGFAPRLQTACPCLRHVDPDLLLKGLQCVARQIRL